MNICVSFFLTQTLLDNSDGTMTLKEELKLNT